MKQTSLIEGNIFSSLVRFALPVLFTLFLQALYGAVDLLVVGQFAQTADVSGVATGSMLLQTVTGLITGLSMGITVLVGKKTGEGNSREAGKAVGSGICIFAVFAVILMLILVIGAGMLSKIMQAPDEAFSQTTAYIRICGAGIVFIVGYNVLGSIFRGIGDSKTPMITVIIACIANIVLDLFFVAVLGMGTSGAAFATVLSQGISVAVSLVIIRKKQLPFELLKDDLKFNMSLIKIELKLGVPIALQDLLVGISFLIIQMVVNTMGVTESAGVGVAEKICVFIMLVPSAYMQSMSAFVAQNMGALKPHRAAKALWYGIFTAVVIGIMMGFASFFYGDIMGMIFSKDIEVVIASHQYLKAYAIDCIFTPFLFCFIGYFNGREKTLFVMLQGIVGAFCVRVPVVFIISGIQGAGLFHIGLATPCSTIVQITMCLIMYRHINQKEKKPDCSGEKVKNIY